MANQLAVGWLGTGRMGAAMSRRLIDAGHDVTVWNRTRAKTDPLAAAGAGVADTIANLAVADVVFVMVSTPGDLEEVITGEAGLLSAERLPRVVVDCSSVGADISARIRRILADRGVAFLASPISGNPHVVAEGQSILMASGDRATYDLVAPLLNTIAKTSVWVGDEEQARTVKICHNLYLGMLVQALSEVTVLAEKSGVPRAAFLEFLNSTVLATDWVRKRTPDMLALDWTPTFTTELLRKDFDLGLAVARDHDVPMPVGGHVMQIIQAAIGHGRRDDDFLSLFAEQAAAAGMQIEPEK